MKVEVDAPSLAQAMSQITVVVNKRVTNPLLTNVLMTAKGGKLRLTGTDNFIGGSVIIAAKVEVEGQCAVEAARLYTLSNALPKKTVKLTERGSKIELRCGSSKYNLMMLPGDDFPAMPRIAKSAKRIEVSTELLLDCVKWTEHGMANDEHRPHLSGMLIDVAADGSCNVVSCDGSQLVKATALFEDSKAFQAFIPHRAVGALKKLCDQGSETIHLAYTASHVFFWTGDVGYNARMLGGDPIPYDRVIPDDKTHADASVKRQDFADAVKRILAMDDMAITLFIDKKKMRLSASSAQAGDGTETLAAGMKGKPLQVSVSAKDLSDAVGVLSGDRVALHLWGENKPVMIRSLDADDAHGVQALLMPMVQDE